MVARRERASLPSASCITATRWLTSICSPWAPAHRRQGLGRQLHRAWLTTTAIEAGVFRINLEVRSRNDEARIFYEALGFDALTVVPGYYQGREAALRMTQRLGLGALR